MLEHQAAKGPAASLNCRVLAEQSHREARGKEMTAGASRLLIALQVE